MINLPMAHASGGRHNQWLDSLAHELSHGSDNLIKGHHRGEGDPDVPFAEYRRNSGEAAAFNATHARRSPDSVLANKLPNERRMFGDIPYKQQILGDLSNGPDSLGWKTYNQHSAHLSPEVIDLINTLMDR